MQMTIGIITYNSEKFATRCLETLVSQGGLGKLGTDWQIVCLDNASKNRIEIARLEQKLKDVRFLKEETNLGFGRAHNLIMRMFPAEFHAVLNVDILFSPNFLEKLLEGLKKEPHAGSAIGKLFRWDLGGNPEKTSYIDSVGLGVTKNHAFFDIGQGKPDCEEWNVPAKRFGGSAAAILYRRSALEIISYGSCHAEESAEGGRLEAFDETMFMYKEDIDLAYRLITAGYSCLYVPSALAWHARGVGKGHKRRNRSEKERTWSTAHETLLLKKHRSWWPRKIQRSTQIRQCVRWIYLFLLEPRVFFGSRRLLKALEPQASRRRDVKHVISFSEVSHFFE
jgi:GT2 family glycosyltransferase